MARMSEGPKEKKVKATLNYPHFIEKTSPFSANVISLFLKQQYQDNSIFTTSRAISTQDAINVSYLVAHKSVVYI